MKWILQKELLEERDCGSKKSLLICYLQRLLLSLRSSSFPLHIT